MADSFSEKFFNFEFINKLFDFELDGFKFWPYIRYEIFISILKLSNYIDNDNNNSKHKFKNLKLIKDIICSLFKSPFRINKQYNILFLASGQANLYKNKYICRFTDLIVDEVEKETETICIADTCINNKNRYRKIRYNLDIIELPHRVYYKLLWKFNTNKKNVVDISNHLSSLIYEEFSIKVSNEYLCKIIYKSLCGYRCVRKKIIRLLNQIKPKCIIYQQYYSLVHMCINEVASAMNIDTIELQHGVISAGHVFYNFYSNNNFAFMPKKIFFWGDYWKDTCRIPVEENNKIVTGFPYYDNQIFNHPHIMHSNYKYRILVLSQDTITNTFITIFEDLISMLDNANINYHIIYKLHPSEMSFDMSIFDSIKSNRNVTFVNNLDISLYECFANSDIQISETSTALFEGLYYNLKTFIYDSDLSRKNLDILVQKYNSSYFKNSKELYDLIINSSNCANNDYEFFFKSNSLKNIKSELSKYL